MSAEVRHGNHRRTLGLQDEEDTEWKPPENGPANLAKDDRKAGRSFFYARERDAKLAQELVSEASPLTVVPRGCLEGVELRLAPDV